ncbi:unnamed protein product [Natator depressus]
MERMVENLLGTRRKAAFLPARGVWETDNVEESQLVAYTCSMCSAQVPEECEIHVCSVKPAPGCNSQAPVPGDSSLVSTVPPSHQDQLVQAFGKAEICRLPPWISPDYY